MEERYSPTDEFQFHKQRAEKRAEQKATKFSDQQIKEHIDNAHANSHYQGADQLYVIAQAQSAIAMMKYNEMIDKRWAMIDQSWTRAIR